MQGIGGGHHGAVAQANFAQRLPRHIVQAKDQVAGEFIEQAVFHHDPPAVQQLFSGLKNQL
jgi:hypothetical protein